MISWKPNPGPQEEFCSLPDTIDEAFYGGALAGGKTAAIVMLPLIRNFQANRHFNGIIFRRTFPELEKHILPMAYRYYPQFGGKYNDTKHLWKFPSGAVMHLGYLDTDEDVYKHDGIEYNYIGYDELTHFTERQYTYPLSRMRTTNRSSGLPTIARSTGMPGNIGHNWVKTRFIDPAPTGRTIITLRVGDVVALKSIFIPARLEDNPILTQEDPNYVNRLRAVLSEQEFEAKAGGNWSAFEGQVFNEFRAYRYKDEPENAIHVIEPFEVPFWWPRIVGIDWGFRANTWIGKFALSPKNRVYLYSEYCQKNKYISEWGADFKRSCQNEKISTIELDPSAWQQRGDEKTIAAQFMEVTGMVVHKADNDRVGGKMLIHEMLRWKNRPPKFIPPEGFRNETSALINRIYGPAKQKEYINMFLPDQPEQNLPRLQIFNTCKAIIKLIPSLVYSEKDPEDVADFDGDDPYDGLRYGLKAVDRYLTGLGNEAERRAKLARILHDREVTGNQTDFYRAMESYEAEQRRGGYGVRLH